MENRDYKNKNLERKYLKNMRNNQFLKAKDGLLELGKYFMELKNRKRKKLKKR